MGKLDYMQVTTMWFTMPKITEYGRIRPKWADEQFQHWLIKNCPREKARCVLLPLELCIEDGDWIQEQFRQQYGLIPDTETAREMFTAMVSIHFSTKISQEYIIQQILEGYLRTIPAKA
jgi:hypothetical protein